MNTRIYIIYALDDHMACDRLIDQAKKAKLAVEFERMLTKTPWVPLWKSQSRTRIRGCDGVIFLISKNTNEGLGTSWELECASEAGLPILGIQVDRMKKGTLPPGLVSTSVIEWNWPEIETFLQSFSKRGWSAST